MNMYMYMRYGTMEIYIVVICRVPFRALSLSLSL